MILRGHCQHSHLEEQLNPQCVCRKASIPRRKLTIIQRYSGIEISGTKSMKKERNIRLRLAGLFWPGTWP
jgi:hypothetical protein